MVIKTRLFWAGWGPNVYDFRGWWFSLLWRPRPDETPIGEKTKAAWCLEVRRDGPDLMWRRRPGIHSSDWTGLQYDWPPTFRLERG